MSEVQQETKPKKLIKTYSSAIVDGFVKKAAACQSLDHKLTKGELRELFVTDVLRHFLTPQFSVGTGIIINHREEQSKSRPGETGQRHKWENCSKLKRRGIRDRDMV